MLKNKEALVAYLGGADEASEWRRLKAVCEREATSWHLPFSPEQKAGWLALLGRGREEPSGSSAGDPASAREL